MSLEEAIRKHLTETYLGKTIKGYLSMGTNKPTIFRVERTDFECCEGARLILEGRNAEGKRAYFYASEEMPEIIQT